MNPFTEPTAPLPESRRSEVGRRLRSARDAAGLTSKDVADQLRIRRLYLEALEDGRYHELPAEAYVTGFIRSYAKFLRLNGPELVEMYKQEGRARPPAPALNMPSPITEERLPSPQIITGAIVGAVVLVILWVSLTSVPEAEPPVPAPAPVLELAAPIVPPPPAQGVPELAPMAGDGAIPSPLAESIAAVVVPVAPASTETLAPPAPLEPTVRVALRAIGTTDILVRGGKGERVIEKTLKTGDVVPLPLRSDLRLDVSNAGALRVVMDGRVLPEFGAAGEKVRNINLDPAAWDLPPIAAMASAAPAPARAAAPVPSAPAATAKPPAQARPPAPKSPAPPVQDSAPLFRID